MAMKKTHSVDLNGKNITTTVTSVPSVVRKWLHSNLNIRPPWLRRRLIVGLGVQWNPYNNPTEADTLQICIGRHCLIIQLSHSSSVPLVLRKFLLNPSHTFVGIWNHSDEANMGRSVHALRLAREPLDLRLHVRDKRTGEALVGASREDIVEEALGFRVWFDKGVGMSEWDDLDLSEDQVSYATLDAYLSFLIGKGLKAWKLN